ncbi:unnamed protein product [Lathyrus oleraceus]|uniref:RING-type domain-containing protein n=1 Tax=Pisum sativum TaxID=3888 RepID=A0A9D4VKB8_PEA|nr:uncharacterized protein LOC127103743 [Pisum sativum]KAI5385514.1 hypothetical protein KIW84_072202 [Pisum sativum]
MASSKVEIASFDSTKNPTWVSRVAKNNNLGNLNLNKRFHNVFVEKDDSSLPALVSPRHSKIIDRWAARQAQEVVRNLEKNNEDVADKVFDHFPSRSSSFNSRRGREVSVSPPLSDGSESYESEKTFNLGASSLVQIWEKRLSQSNCTKQNVALIGRTSSDSSSNGISAFSVEDHSRVSEEEESSDEPFQNCSSKVHCNLDAGESDKTKVADIIKKLSITNQMQSDENDTELSNSATGSPSVSTPKQLSERRCFGKITNYPRIRGRQAFNDLIMQFESDRHGELNNLAEQGAVSKFTQRGRIQSLLRLRLLQRGVAAFDPPRLKSTTPEGNKQQHGSVIMQLRERFNTRDEQRTSSLIELSKPRLISKNSVSQTSAYIKEEAQLCSGFETQNDAPKEIVEASISKTDSNTNIETTDKVETREQQSYDTIENSCSEILEENDCSDYNYDETRESYDWAGSISRPRSYWEEIRQEWYREMLDFGSHDDERRKLLERRTVSTVLSSDFRGKMDKLMNSHRGTQTHLVNNQIYEEEREGSMQELTAFFHDRFHVRGNLEENGRDMTEKEVPVEEESVNSGSDHELGDSQSSSSVNSPSSASWSYGDTDGGDDSDRVVFVSSPLPSQSQSFYQDNRQYCPSTNHQSIDMEFIYDMRGQMEQLFREMSELRKTLKYCTDMNMQLQQSQKQEVHKVREKKFTNKTSKKGKCCICNENKVNAVLYRCGHMCACFKCASELQWKSGKCPICQVEIIDVVQVYTNT